MPRVVAWFAKWRAGEGEYLVAGGCGEYLSTGQAGEAKTYKGKHRKRDRLFTSIPIIISL